MYITRKKKLGQSEKLDAIAKACGEVWSDTAKWFWRFVDRKGEWVSKYTMMRWICTQQINGTDTPIGSKESRKEIGQQTAQGVVSEFYQALDSWRKRRGQQGARPPYKMKRFYKGVWNNQQIKIKKVDGKRYLRLSCTRKVDPLMIEWPHPEPKRVEIGWDGEQYELRCQYEVEPDEEPKGNKTAGIDLGEVHIAVAHDGEDTIICNGRELRSKRRYQNKLKQKLDSKIDRKKRGSRRWWRLVTSKKKQLAKVRNQIRDILHKQSTRLVEELHERRCSTLVIGDVRNIRDDMDYGSKANQTLHQWAHNKFRQMLTYKAKLKGMSVDLEDEAYTSQTCPSCGNRYKPRGRDYVCRECGANFHRDEVGARNIRQKYLDPTGWSEGYAKGPVVAGRAPATDEDPCSSPSGKGLNGPCKTQLDLFQSAAMQKREMPLRKIHHGSLWGIRYRPHMDCGSPLDKVAEG